MSARELVALMLLGSAAVAAPAAAETLREALIAAYDTNPSLTAAREGQRATNEGVPLAKANGRPNVIAQPTYFENKIKTMQFFLFCFLVRKGSK